MGKKYNQLSLEERCRLSILQQEGYSLQKIASAWGCSASTLSREIKRNQMKPQGYGASYAQTQTRAPRWKGGTYANVPLGKRLKLLKKTYSI